MNDDYNAPLERPRRGRVSPLLGALLAVGAIGYPIPLTRAREYTPNPRLTAHDLEYIAAAAAKRARKAAKKKGAQS